jgi:hypothetical protein
MFRVNRATQGKLVTNKQTNKQNKKTNLSASISSLSSLANNEAKSAVSVEGCGVFSMCDDAITVGETRRPSLDRLLTLILLLLLLLKPHVMARRLASATNRSMPSANASRSTPT